MLKNEMSKSDVLLTYGWVRSTYSALRSLTAQGLMVTVSDTSPVGMCQLSRFKKDFYPYASPIKNEEKFITDLNSIIKQCGAKVLIPSHDETEVIARNINRFPDSIEIPIPNVSQLTIANNKYKSAEAAAKVEIPVPISFEYNTIVGLEKLLAKKPSDQRYVIKLRRGNSSKGVFYTVGVEETLRKVESLIEAFRLTANRYPVVQEFVSGEGWGVSCLYWQGQKIASFTHRRLREKLETGGTSTLRQQWDNPLLESMAYKLLDSLEWHGLAMVEFKYDPVSNRGWFIEINPRMWGSMALPVVSGVPFPYLLYLCAMEGAESAKNCLKMGQQQKMMRARWYLGDIIVCVQKLKALKFEESIQLLLPGGTEYYDDLVLNDPGAFLGELGYYGYQFVKHRSLNPVAESVVG